jgi:hypothetical protein
MGNGLLRLWLPERSEPERSPAPPVEKLRLPGLPELQDRFGNRGVARLLYGKTDAVAPAAPVAGVPTATGNAPPRAEPVAAEPGTEPAATEPPKTDEPADERAPPRLALGNPVTDAAASAADYALITRLMALGIDPLNEKALRLDTWSGRWARLGIGSGLAWVIGGLATLGHELGHYREQSGFNLDPSLDWPKGGWNLWSGGSHPSRRGDLVQRLITAGAGVNQNTRVFGSMYADMVRNGSATFPEAMGLFMARVHSLYPARTQFLDWFAEPKSDDDFIPYLRDLKERGHGLSLWQLALIGGVPWALSPSGFSLGWSFLKDYLWRGKQHRFSVNTWRALGVPFSRPELRTYFSTEGPILGAETLLWPRGDHPLQLDLDVRPGTPGVALGGTLYNLRKGPFALDLSAGVSLDKALGLGGRLGGDLSLYLPGDLRLIVSPSLESDFLTTEASGSKTGFGLNVYLARPMR